MDEEQKFVAEYVLARVRNGTSAFDDEVIGAARSVWAKIQAI